MRRFRYGESDPATETYRFCKRLEHLFRKTESFGLNEDELLYAQRTGHRFVEVALVGDERRARLDIEDALDLPAYWNPAPPHDRQRMVPLASFAEPKTRYMMMTNKPWSKVGEGSVVLIKGERWKVTERNGPRVTMEHQFLGTRTGEPPPDTVVQVVEEAKTAGDRISRSDMAQMARDNETSVSQVEAVMVQVSLGGSFIAEVADDGSPAQAPYVEVMDVQMLRNHLAYFHGEYPADVRLEHLIAVHEDLRATEPHEHSVSF